MIATIREAPTASGHPNSSLKFEIVSLVVGGFGALASDGAKAESGPL